MTKTWKIIYIISTALVSLGLLLGSYSELIQNSVSVELMNHLGYPLYLLYIIGVAKFLAVIGILQKFSSTLREWAYAGIVIDLVGAIASHIFVGDGISVYISAIVFLAITFLSYAGMRKRFAVKV